MTYVNYHKRKIGDFMAFVQCDFHSEVLGFGTSINVILPKKTGLEKYPVLYLLHGLTDDHTAWQRKTSIERYAISKNLAIIMPNVHRSFYTDMTKGYDYWTYMTEELPELVHSYFPISQKRAENFVAGLSMGGYGAFKWAFRKPEKFAAAASLSGALNMARRIFDFEDNKKRMEEFELIFGNLQKVKNSKNDIFYLLKSLANDDQEIPRLYQCCGTDDFLYEDNLRFKNLCEKEGISLNYEEEKAEHEWDYWDRKIKDIIYWLPNI